MSLKNELNDKLGEYTETGEEIGEKASELIKEGEVSKEAFDQIEAIDEDDKAALDAAWGEASHVAETLAESEIRDPGENLNKEIENLSAKAKEYRDTELKDASRASEAVGNYREIGAKFSNELKKSGEAFGEISKESDKTSAEFSAEFAKRSAELESIW